MTVELNAVSDEPGDPGLLFTATLDPTDHQMRFPVGHPYLELVYMPLIGATAVALLRRLGLLFAGSTTATIEVDAPALARELGLRAGSAEAVGERSPLMKTLSRLTRQNLITRVDHRHFGVCLCIPSLDDCDVRRIPEPIRRIHYRYLEVPGRPSNA